MIGQHKQSGLFVRIARRQADQIIHLLVHVFNGSAERSAEAPSELPFECR